MKVLITLTDLEPAVRLNAALERGDVKTELISPMEDLPSAIESAKPDVIVLTGNLADPANIHIARRQLWEGAAVVGLADVDDPALRERLRAAGFAEVHAKPVSIGDVADSVRRILERRRLQTVTGLIGESEAIREVLVKIEQMAPVSSTVLIEGESGTGKELVARAMHQMSGRRSRPFIAVNVGALPDTLLESELFGHEKGAFTGAAERRLGRFELADTGTLFLDEIGEIPSSTQVKLLRVLEEREVMRVGGTQPFRVDVRVIAATNRPLRESVEIGEFRSDLYYRLNVLRIYLPPLRERRSDIPILLRRFIDEFSREHDRPFAGISPEAAQLMIDYPWPGNVRELRNLVESMVVLSHGREIQPADLPRQIREGNARLLPVRIGSVDRSAEGPGTSGRELEFILRSLVDLKLQVEDLRRRVDERGPMDRWIGEVQPAALAAGQQAGSGVGAVTWGQGIEPPPPGPPPNVVTVTPGMTMAEIERAAIEAALRETRGNRRKAAELLAIGERTLYRKLREYHIPETI